MTVKQPRPERPRLPRVGAMLQEFNDLNLRPQTVAELKVALQAI